MFSLNNGKQKPIRTFLIFISNSALLREQQILNNVW